jgi:hypothetical protein
MMIPCRARLSKACSDIEPPSRHNLYCSDKQLKSLAQTLKPLKRLKWPKNHLCGRTFFGWGLSKHNPYSGHQHVHVVWTATIDLD